MSEKIEKSIWVADSANAVRGSKARNKVINNLNFIFGAVYLLMLAILHHFYKIKIMVFIK